ncbi:Predicted transcriptional regulator YdeE, contains AraC-type DNA-binding domain [Evansella caseinilytica]|uniref:Predicted transcriptional regulator YdeE, contains AraC-type DNA-binding domain n=1 Tax=Evansella caseinilytica TaxID=1503961 RepID=A0A1H3Q8P2_9BACI|nr:GyrI-like domain-containing protein [Evansella caseinilytica]SDZ09766.1 Predicted transcriptional regulator YdeE, contains AraC-type DNA-binding domain [Evansella caseinilytica]
MSQTIQEKRVSREQASYFIGKAVTTTNEAEMKGEGVISGQWASYYQDGVFERIPNKKHAGTLAIYTDYQSGETGPYTFALGAEVSAVEEVPQGMKAYSIPASDYVVFTTRTGPVQEIVVEAWQYIWEWSKTNKRAFKTDFELYDDRCADPDNSQVDIYISVK